MQNLQAFWDWLGNTELAFQIGATWWFPLLESIHVIAVVMLVANILLVDLRLLNKISTRFSATLLMNEHLPWVWGAFIVAVVTGLGLFISRPAAYAANPAFQLKLLFLLGLGINAWFSRRPSYAKNLLSDQSHSPDSLLPLNAQRYRIAAFLSLLLWASVVFAGRWVGHIN